jgi:hypothetical protein
MLLIYPKTPLHLEQLNPNNKQASPVSLQFVGIKKRYQVTNGAPSAYPAEIPFWSKVKWDLRSLNFSPPFAKERNPGLRITKQQHLVFNPNLNLNLFLSFSDQSVQRLRLRLRGGESTIGATTNES